MTFRETELAGAFVLELERHADQRGFFARSFCREEFSARGLDPAVVQCNVSFNLKRGTLRGLHYQAEPHAENKLVRCPRGGIYDVIVDGRPESPTYRRWLAVELSARNQRQLYIPKGFAHGFQTLEDETEVFYQMSEYHHPEAARGMRWDDPQLAIVWPPCPQRIISERDLSFEYLPQL